MTEAQVASNFVHAVRKRKHTRLARYRRILRAIPDHSTSSGFAIGEDGSIVLDNGKGNRDGDVITSSSQSSLAVITSTTSGQPNQQTVQAVSTIPSSTPSTNALSLPQTSSVVYIPQYTSPSVPSPSLTTIVMSSALPSSPVNLITEVPAQSPQFFSKTFTPPSIVFTTTTLLPSRSTSTVVATTTAAQGDLPVTNITSTSALVYPLTITTIVPASGTNSELSTTIVTLTTDSARSTARGAGKAITNAGSGTNSDSGTAALPSGLPSSDPEYGLRVTHNPPLIIGLVLGSILLLSACAAGAGWVLRARRRWHDHRIAALGIDTRTSFGNASALFVPDPTWYREESKESDDATQRGGGMDTRRASISLEAESSQNKDNEAVTGVGTFYGVAKTRFGDSSAPQQPGEHPSSLDPSFVADCSLTVAIANSNLCSYNYPSAAKYAYEPAPAQHDHPIPISVVPSRTRSRSAPLSLPLALSATARFSRSTFVAASRLPTPAFGERNRGELRGNWRASTIGPANQATVGCVGHGVDPPTTSGRRNLERMTESTSIARVGTVDQSYENGRRSPLKLVGELTRVVTVDGPGSASTGSRVEEKLKRMREKRRELERV
jgi:hypothetical protein